MFLQFEGAEATMEGEEGERFISKQPLWVVSPVEGDLGRRAKSKSGSLAPGSQQSDPRVPERKDKTL